jgi:hypothetical protein
LRIFSARVLGLVVTIIALAGISVVIALSSIAQPSGLSFNQGQAVIMTERGLAAHEGENATITFVLLTRTNPDGSGSGTSVTYFSTNSTGQLAFLDNMIAIGQVEYSPDQGINRFAEWEWKGGTLPFESILPR